jgi:hypothetical protein
MLCSLPPHGGDRRTTSKNPFPNSPPDKSSLTSPDKTTPHTPNETLALPFRPNHTKLQISLTNRTIWKCQQTSIFTHSFVHTEQTLLSKIDKTKLLPLKECTIVNHCLQSVIRILQFIWRSNLITQQTAKQAHLENQVIRLRRFPMFTDSNDLSLEQQFSLRSFESQVQQMNREQAQEYLVKLYEQMLSRENAYKEVIKHQWGL